MDGETKSRVQSIKVLLLQSCQLLLEEITDFHINFVLQIWLRLYGMFTLLLPGYAKSGRDYKR